MKSRLIVPADFETFSKWASNTTEVQIADMEAVLRNRTTVTIVTENEQGKVIMFSPVFCVLRNGFNSFNPEATKRERVEAIYRHNEALKEFANRFGIDDIMAFVQPGCVVSDWCQDNEWKQEPRSVILMRSR